MRVQGANSCEPGGTQANSRREASPTSSCRHFKQFAAGSFPLYYFLSLKTVTVQLLENNCVVDTMKNTTFSKFHVAHNSETTLGG